MSDSFSQWTGRVDAATDDAARRALLAEIGVWRVRNLSDLGAQREAAYAIASLYASLGDGGAALREAQNLMSLCRTPPMVSAGALEQARHLVKSLGGSPGPAPREPRSREPRGEHPVRGERNERRRDSNTEGPGGGLRAAIAAGIDGRWSDGFKALRNRKGPQAELARIWLDLRRSLDEDEEHRIKRLRAVIARLDKSLGAAPTERASTRPEQEEQGEIEPGSLDALIGRYLPKRREKRLRTIDRFLQDNPDAVDEVAALALRDHVKHAGPQQPAPWLVRYTALGMAAGGEHTRAALNDLTDMGAFAVSAYAEAPFGVLIELVRDLRSDGFQIVDLRRGIQREEPADRRLWTLRAQRRGGAEVMVVVGPPSDSPYPEGTAALLAKRVQHLSHNAVLHAPGEGNASLREVASALGVRIATSELAGAVRQAAGSSAPRPPAPAPDSSSPATSREAAPRLADLITAVKDCLDGDPIDMAALATAVAPIRKVRDVFALVRDPLEERRLVPLLKALHEVVPEHIRLLEGTTLALRTAAIAGPQSETGALLTAGPQAERYGGAGMDIVLPVAVAVQHNGWELFRVLRGATRRERREHPVVESLADHVSDLWRLLLRKGDERSELWVVGALAPEGRAVVPQLLLEERKRVAILPLDPELLSSWRELGGPDAIGWTGDATEVIEALG